MRSDGKPLIRIEPFCFSGGRRFHDGIRINSNERGQYAEGWLIDYVNGMFKQFDGKTRFMEPPVDVIEDNDFYHFSFEMPGLENEWLDARVENGQLRVVGERKLPELSKETKVGVAERGYGTLRRAFKLPHNANHEKSVAGYKHGVLEVTDDKKPEGKSVIHAEEMQHAVAPARVACPPQDAPQMWRATRSESRTPPLIEND